MVIVHLVNDEIVSVIFFNGSESLAHNYASKSLIGGCFDIVTETTYNWKYNQKH